MREMNELVFRLLRLLGGGEFHSGTALGGALGVSRATVWNAVRALERADLQIYKVRGRGYKLSEPISLLDAKRVMRFVPRASPVCVRIIDIAESTNSVLMQLATAGADNATVVAAEWQQRGRGRMGRAWHAGVGGALTFSILWRFTQGAGAIAGLSLAVGVAVMRALNSLGASGLKLKWPNDVLSLDRKLAGILIEMQGDALGPSAVVIGIGLNVRLSAAVRARIDQPAADLETACGCALDRNEVLAVLLDELVQVLNVFASSGFASMREEWEQYHAQQNQSVLLRLPTGKIETGVALGVAEDGALLFKSGLAVRRLHSGEISLRPAEPATPGKLRARSTAKARV
jgi:BirA family transcriptional regulator, biotin operon repressor / biotin---[acetyl-CoA-carboxylase] ligase